MNIYCCRVVKHSGGYSSTQTLEAWPAAGDAEEVGPGQSLTSDRVALGRPVDGLQETSLLLGRDKILQHLQARGKLRTDP